MKIKISILLIFVFFICLSCSEASICNVVSDAPYYPNGLAITTGYVQQQGRNFITIFDENQEKNIRIVLMSHDAKFVQGDYVRAYYYPDSLMVQRIFKMTVLPYNKTAQNLGYICRKD